MPNLKGLFLYAYINYLTVSGAVLAKIFWQYSKLFLKTFGKIGRRVETDNIAYFIDSVFSGLNQLGCHFQPFQLNKLIGGNLSDSLYFSMQAGTAHIHFLWRNSSVENSILSIFFFYDGYGTFQ